MPTDQTNRVIVQPSVRDVEGGPFAIEEFPDATYRVDLDDGSLYVEGPTRTAHFPKGSYAFVTRERPAGSSKPRELLRRSSAALADIANAERNRGYTLARVCLDLSTSINDYLKDDGCH